MNKKIEATNKSFNLNVLRVLICLILAYLVSRSTFGYDRLYLTSHLYHPIPIFEFLGIGQLNLTAVAIVRTTLIVSLLCAALGVYTRISLLVAAAMYFLYFGNQLGFIKSSFSDYVYHSKNLAFYVLLIMALAPEIDRFSIDGLKKNTWSGWPKTNMTRGFQGIDAIHWMLGLAYLGSAVSKLMKDWQWADGYTLQSYLLRKHLLYDNALGGIIMQNLDWCKWLGILTLLFEITFVFCLIFRRLKPIYIIGGIMFHTMIYLTMNINFGVYFFMIYLALINYAGIPRIKDAIRKFDQTVSIAKANSPWSPRRIRRYALGALLAFQCVSIVFELESWPVSNYGVFINRHVPSDITEYRFACCCDGDDEYKWIPREHLPRSQTTLSRMIRLSVQNHSEAELTKVHHEVMRHLIRKDSTCNEIALLRGHGVMQDDKLVPMFEVIRQDFIGDWKFALTSSTDESD